MIRRTAIERHSKSFVEDSLFYKPIFKAVTGPFTQSEWEVILSNSVAKSAEMGRQNRYTSCHRHILKVEHLSLIRLKQSFIDGLDKVNSLELRKHIWQLLCSVPQQKFEFAEGVF